MQYTCPCCGYKTLPEEANGTFNICPVCFWEDDNVQLKDPNYKGGANHVSLKEAQNNFITFGACEKIMVKNVRPANTSEPKDSGWKPFE